MKYLILLLFVYCNTIEQIPALNDLTELSKKQKKENEQRFLLGLFYRTRTSSSRSNFPETISQASCSNFSPQNPFTVDTTIYTAGYRQVSSTNQDAFIKRVTNQIEIWNQTSFDTSSDDSRGEAIAANSTSLFVAFSVTGGNTGFTNFVSSDAVQRSYGVGGGPKVTFLARLSPSTGEIQRGTFLGARLTNGRVNTLNPCQINITGSNEITFIGQTAYDAGVANDSLQKNQICDSGKIRRIKLNFDLNTISSITCEDN
jgi:hypothetical protein